MEAPEQFPASTNSFAVAGFLVEEDEVVVFVVDEELVSSEAVEFAARGVGVAVIQLVPFL